MKNQIKNREDALKIIESLPYDFKTAIINLNMYYKFTEDFIKNNEDLIIWDYVLFYQKLSEKFMIEYSEKFDKSNWDIISYKQDLTENFIRQYKDKLNWNHLSYYQKELSENFIKEFKDKVNWKAISIIQDLSEDFIREFQDKVDWKYISLYQKLSENFIRENQDKVDFCMLKDNKNCNYSKIIKEFWDDINENK